MDANIENKNEATVWCDDSTRLLLDKYEQYLPLIGPMKQFKNKKTMWIQISNDIMTELNIERSAIQCENRYKTILKRKNQSVKSNQQSGAKRRRVEFEEELNKIKAIDDSLEPEVLQGPGKIIENNKENIVKDCTAQKKTTKKMSISETLLQIQKDKEERRERRHAEKLEVLRNFMMMFSTDNTINDNSD